MKADNVDTFASGGACKSTLKLWGQPGAADARDTDLEGDFKESEDEEDDHDIEGNNVLIVLENTWRYMEKTASWQEEMKTARPDNISVCCLIPCRSLS